MGSLAIDRLNLTGRVALHDAASRSTLELNDIAFSGDVRSLAGSIRGDGNFMLRRASRYPFRVSSGQTQDGNGTRVHLNIDPGQRALALDLDGVLNFEQRAPRFDGTVTLAAPARSRASPLPWRIMSKVKADYAAARLDQIEVSYGPEERALRFAGNGDVSFGASPLLRASLSARQLDADRFAARDNTSEPVRVLPAMRALLSGIPPTPIATQIEFSSDQIMLGGRPLQDVAAELHGDGETWTVRRLEFRAPGTTKVSLSGARDAKRLARQFQGRAQLRVRRSGRADHAGCRAAAISPIAAKNRCGCAATSALRQTGFAIDDMKAELDGGAVEGRVAVSHPQPGGGARVEADLKAERLDLDAATALWCVRWRVRRPSGRRKRSSRSTSAARMSSGQELRPLVGKARLRPKTISLDQLKIGQPGGVTMEGSGSFDRANATGKLALNSSAASFNQLTALIAPLAPSVVARLNADGDGVRARRAQDSRSISKGSRGRPTAPMRASCSISIRRSSRASPRSRRSRRSRRSTASTSKRSGAAKSRSNRNCRRCRAAPCSPCWGSTAPSRRARVPRSSKVRQTARGARRSSLKAKISGAGLDAEAQGTAEPWAQEPKANVTLKIGSVNLAPLLDLKPADKLAQNSA